ncbi:TOBE domain-containing protein [Enterococcus mundtii]|nr:TOBE domain-containing protein [Enterococcus mundtii]
MTDGKYYLGIRPEDILPSDKGPLKGNIQSVELIGRERILHFELAGERIKSIVRVENEISEGTVITFDLAYHKVFIFRLDGERIY